MTAFSCRASGAVLALLLPLCRALNLTVPGTIQAGVPTEVTVGFDFWKQRYSYMDDTASDVRPVCYNPPEDGCSADALYQHYRLYLFHAEWMDICYLSDLIPIGTTNPNVTIPVDLGPPDTYEVRAIEFNGTVMYTPPDGVGASNDFALEGTNVSSWTPWERYGGWLKPYDDLPCSSYACFRACGLRYSDGNGSNIKGTTGALFDCWNACPGVQADPTQQGSLWSWYCDTGSCSGLAAPAGATTPPVATNVIPITLAGAAYPSGAAAEGPTALPTATTTTTTAAAAGGLAAATGTRSGAATATPTKASGAAPGRSVPAWSWSGSAVVLGLLAGAVSS